jgi:lipopolysaccharide biosynthesis glycosyltransferase
VFATDEGYVQHLAVAMQSLLENNIGLEFNIYLINGGLDKKKYALLSQIIQPYNALLINIEIDDFQFESLVQNYHFTKANYYRLLIPEYIKVEKILYLDADIVVNGSIEDLYGIDINDVYLGAVENPGFNRHRELKMNLNSAYFNSGVLLINLKYWNENQLQSRVVDFVSNNSDVIEFVDQCGLNAIVDGCWKKIPLKFNQQSVIFDEEYMKVNNCFNDFDLNIGKESPVIIHYTGSSKPWHLRNKHPYKYLYWKYLRRTPFKRYFSNDFTLFNLAAYFLPIKIKNLIRRVK